MGVFKIKNERWDGVPFILRCGKGKCAQKQKICLVHNEMFEQDFVFLSYIVLEYAIY